MSHWAGCSDRVTLGDGTGESDLGGAPPDATGGPSSQPDASGPIPTSTPCVEFDGKPMGDGALDLLWTGSEYAAVVFARFHALSFARLDANGSHLGLDQRFDTVSASCRGDGWSASLAWSGSEFGVVWYQDAYEPDCGAPILAQTGVYFSRISATGVRTGTPTQLDSNTLQTAGALIWNGSNFARITGDMSGINLRHFDVAGVKLGSPIVLDPSQMAFFYQRSQVAWTGADYALAWLSNPPPVTQGNFLKRVDSAGVAISPRTTLSTRDESDLAHNPDVGPVLAWTGSRFGLLRNDRVMEGPYQLVFSQVDGAGNAVGAPIVLDTLVGTATVNPGGSNFRWLQPMSVVWTGTEYGVEWFRRDGNAETTHIQKVDVTGAKVGAERVIPGRVNSPMVWTGNGFGVPWFAVAEQKAYLSHVCL